MNRPARWSRSSGWEGSPPRWPKSSGVATSPLPNTHCQTRLTITRAVSGLSAEAISRATSPRPLPAGLKTNPPGVNARTYPGLTNSPGLAGSPRASTGCGNAGPASANPGATCGGFRSASSLRYSLNNAARSAPGALVIRPFNRNHSSQRISSSEALPAANDSMTRAEILRYSATAWSSDCGGGPSYSPARWPRSALGVSPQSWATTRRMPHHVRGFLECSAKGPR